jgi:hypothetical protein
MGKLLLGKLMELNDRVRLRAKLKWILSAICCALVTELYLASSTSKPRLDTNAMSLTNM